MNVVVIFDYITGKEDKKNLLTNDASDALVARSRERFMKIIERRNRRKRKKNRVAFSSLVQAPKNYKFYGDLKNPKERRMLSSSDLRTRGGSLFFQADDVQHAQAVVTELVVRMDTNSLKNIQIFCLG